MSSHRRNRAGRLLAAVLAVFLAFSAAQAVLATQTGTLAGLLFAAAVGYACYPAGRRRPPAPATPARRPQPARAPARRRRTLRAQIARDTARLLISRR